MTTSPFYQGIQYFKEELPYFNEYGQESAIPKGLLRNTHPMKKPFLAQVTKKPSIKPY